MVEVDKERGRIGLRLADDPEIAGKTAEELAAIGTGDRAATAATAAAAAVTVTAAGARRAATVTAAAATAASRGRRD